ncbi:MAG: hypothetical protein KJO59_13885 [Ignavibacteria bacterium]|nr:hypothetical protein [Ignavibacteria bacterium]
MASLSKSKEEDIKRCYTFDKSESIRKKHHQNKLIIAKLEGDVVFTTPD